jgi:uncharacterized protein YkwD
VNWVDLVIIILLLFFTLEGLGKSFTLELLDFLSFLFALALSLRFYNQASLVLQNQFQLAHSLANVAGFFIVWSLVEIVLALIIQQTVHRSTLIRAIDLKLKPLAPIPSFFRGLIFAGVLLVLVGTFPVQPQVKIAVDSSKLGKVILAKAYQLEAPLKGVFGGITKDTLTFLTIEPKTDETVNLGFQTSNFHPREDLEIEMIALVNKERTSRGLNALTYDPKLRVPAREHSSDMFQRGYFSHYSPEGKTVADRAEKAGIDYQVIGENLAYAPSLELAHDGLMNSPGHRANILSPDFNKVGIGIEDGGAYGLMITQVFSN